jgi:MoxR-like ATPase
MEALRSNLRAVIRGKEAEIELLLIALFGGGSVLLNDVPGVGKTSLAKAIARSVGGTFRRIQFTPDLLPADILGGSIYNPREATFAFRRGPVFAHVLLADEINRASPRTQSSLLEAMAEGQVSIEGESHPLPAPFWVVATQNPVEFHGTYPLPEAQLDRFAIELHLGYPPPEEEAGILSARDRVDPLLELEPVTTPEELLEHQERVRGLHVDEDVKQYIVTLVGATRTDARLQLGASPRAAIALYRMSQARAYLGGREAVLPDDVKAMAAPVLAHRLALETKARHAGATKRGVVEEILAATRVPV